MVRASTVLPAPSACQAPSAGAPAPSCGLRWRSGWKADRTRGADPAGWRRCSLLRRRTVRTVTRSARCGFGRAAPVAPPASITPVHTLPPATGELRPALLPPPMRCAPMMRALARTAGGPLTQVLLKESPYCSSLTTRVYPELCTSTGHSGAFGWPVLAPAASAAVAARLARLAHRCPADACRGGARRLRLSIPAARSLPLSRTCGRTSGSVTLDYLDGRAPAPWT